MPDPPDPPDHPDHPDPPDLLILLSLLILLTARDCFRQEGRLEQVKGRKSLATLATQADKRVLNNIKVRGGEYTENASRRIC